MKVLHLLTVLSLIACSCSSRVGVCECGNSFGEREINIPTIDISAISEYQQVIAPGAENLRNGHPNAILLPDGKTIYLIWTIGHGGPCTELKRSDDGGLNWSEKLTVPDNWKDYANCPPLYLLKDPQGKERLLTYANRTPYGLIMAKAYSEDLGKTWSPFSPVLCSEDKTTKHTVQQGSFQESSAVRDTLKADVMPFTAIEPIDGGKRLLGITNMRRPFQKGMTNLLVQSYSQDGGLTWDKWRIILDLDEECVPCEPELVRSPDGKELLMIIRDNNRANNSWMMKSRNEGKTWSQPMQLPASVTMDRHQADYLPDGRIIVIGRDVAENSPCKGHFVAWVGTYDDLANGNEGQYRIKMLHSFKTTEYPGLAVLSDGTVVAITSLPYREGENYSIVQSRFNISDIDRMYKEETNRMK